MADMNRHDDPDTESAYISAQLQELAQALGISQAELARRVGIDRRVLNPYWTGQRPAGLPTIRKIARATGRSVAWLLGERETRPSVGSADSRGFVTMTGPLTAPSSVRFVYSVGPFAAGTEALVDPSDHYTLDVYMLVRPRAVGAEAWFAWGRREGNLDLLDRLDGELHVYTEARYEVLGVIVGMIVPPPKPPSA